MPHSEIFPEHHEMSHVHLTRRALPSHYLPCKCPCVNEDTVEIWTICRKISNLWCNWTFFLVFSVLLGLQLPHMKVPRLGVQRSCSHWPTPEPQQGQIQAVSVTYTTAHGNTGSLTHWARPGIKPTISWFLVRFVNYCATTGTPVIELFNAFYEQNIWTDAEVWTVVKVFLLYSVSNCWEPSICQKLF